MAIQKLSAPDLTQRPPRSARVALGGYVILPRCLDKGRATLAGKNGEFHFDCPLDQHFLNFAGIKAADLKKQLALGKGDEAILRWVKEHSKTQPTPLGNRPVAGVSGTTRPGRFGNAKIL